jgi:hypothetical protein
MRKTILFLCFVLAAACSKDEFCIQPQAVAMTMNFKTYDTSLNLVDTPLVEATVFNLDTSYFFVDNAVSLTRASVALKQGQSAQTYVIRHSNENDTVLIRYQTDTNFISNGCGYQTFFTLESASSRSSRIDSVNITSERVDNSNTNPHLEIIYK